MSHTGEASEPTPSDAPQPGLPLGPQLRRRHRVEAAVALIALAAALVFLVIGVVRSLPQVLFPLVFGGLAAYLGWQALRRRGVLRVVLAIGCGVAVLGVVGTVAWTIADFPSILIAALLALVAAAFGGSALQWIHQPSGHLVRASKRPVLIVNPRSGDGAAERAGLSEAARQRGIRVVELGPDDDLPELARAAVREGCDCLGMAGGDGSLALIASIAIDNRIPFVCVPAGTRNHFALDLGLDRNDPLAALDSFGEAVQRRIDVATVNGRMFLNNVSIGAYGEIVASEEYRENKIGVALDKIPDLIGPDAEPLDLHFVDGDGNRHESAVIVHVSNNSYVLSPRLGFSSRPSLVDGELGVVAVTQAGESGPPLISQWQTPSFRIESAATVASGIDGEYVDLESPVEFELRHLALRIRMPRDVAGVSPGAKRAPLTLRTVRRLWSVATGRPPV